jgi:hypothetical protein
VTRGTLVVRDADWASSRALTVAELQQALRSARAGGGSPRRNPKLEMVEPPPISAATPPTIDRDTYVVGAHPGVGASTVALALADVAAGFGPVHLVEQCHTNRSGLASAAEIELGELPDGLWRRGRRGPVVIDRSVTDAEPGQSPPHAEGPQVIDLGAVDVDAVPANADVVLVCRATVPGLRAAEAWLTSARFPSSIVVAAVGRPRWPGPVRATVGPQLRDLRANGQVVTIPLDRHLECNGPNTGPLPKAVLAAARTITSLLPASQRVAS